jgi:hypothetical protein
MSTLCSTAAPIAWDSPLLYGAALGAPPSHPLTLLVDRYQAAKQELAAKQLEVDALKRVLIDQMGSATRLDVPLRPLTLHYTTVQVPTIDVKALRAKHLRLATRFTRDVEQRRFSVRTRKE